MTVRNLLALTGSLVLLAACQPASDTPSDPARGGDDARQATSSTTPAAPLNPSQAEYKAANDMMHEGMGRIDPDPDIAFMQGMAAHHQGAIAMSNVALKHARDPEVRALATRIKKAQTPEISEMERWLARRDQAGRGADAAKPSVDASNLTAADHAAMGH